MKSLLGIAIVCAGFAATALAQPPSGGGYGLPPGRPGGTDGQPPNAMFSAIDTDGDGAISTRELRRAIVALKQLDTDKDGKITQAEAMSGPSVPNSNPTAAIDDVMRNDKNGDGKLSKSEIPRQMAQMLDGADANHDGAIDLAELTSAMATQRSQFSGAGGRSGLGSGTNGFNRGAGDPRPGGPNLIQNDRNGDGQLSADELPAQMRGMLRVADQDHNGSLSPQEIQAIQQRVNERVRGDRALPPGVSIGPQGISGTPQNR